VSNESPDKHDGRRWAGKERTTKAISLLALHGQDLMTVLTLFVLYARKFCKDSQLRATVNKLLEALHLVSRRVAMAGKAHTTVENIIKSCILDVMSIVLHKTVTKNLVFLSPPTQ
jgi:nicotinamide riboside transporter PnuC